MELNEEEISELEIIYNEGYGIILPGISDDFWKTFETLGYLKFGPRDPHDDHCYKVTPTFKTLFYFFIERKKDVKKKFI